MRRGQFDFAPLAHATAKRGSLSSLLSQSALDAKACSRLTRAWTRAIASGAVGWRTVDEVCCVLLRIHPSELYGNAWFDDVTHAQVDEQDIDDEVAGIDPASDIHNREVAA